MEHKDDANRVPHPIRDTQGFRRTGPAKRWLHLLEQRLGKTPITLNELELFRRDYNIKWAVGFAPNSFKPEWIEESERWGVSRPAYAFSSADRRGAQRFIDRNRAHGGLLVVNYEALIYDDTLTLLADLIGPDTYLFGDETVNIKNSQAVSTKNAITLAKDAGVRRSLTGKPIVQGPHDMWAQARFAGELNGFNYYAFRNTYCKMGGFQAKQVKGVKNEEQFQEWLDGCAFQARRTHWLTTPGVEYAQRKLEMLPEQKVHYKRMEEDFLTLIVDHLDEEVIIPADQIITKLLKLQQISSGFIIDEEGNTHDIMPPSRNPLVLEVQRMLRDEISTKVLIFAHHTHLIALLMEALKEFEPAIIAGQGQMKTFDRDTQAEKRRFNGDPRCRIMIGQERAIKYGHTLMGAPDDPCLNEIYAENSYSLDDRSQTEQRAQGDGQAGLITIWDFIPSPIALAAILALQRKEDMSAAVMGYARDTGLLPNVIS